VLIDLAEVLLRADAVGLGEPRPDLGVNLGGHVQPEGVQEARTR
jgi:hypothetical protein